ARGRDRPRRHAQARSLFHPGAERAPALNPKQMAKIPMTVEGAERLKSELQRLKTVERPAIIQAIADARSHGDLSENADYDAAKERQGFIEGRISDVESKLANAQI